MSTTILIVDDERDLLDPLRFAFERRGYRTVAVERGAAALALIADPHCAPPAAILIDRMLPDMSGFEVVAALRASPTTRGVPIIMVSACAEYRAPADLGLQDYVTKPFRMSALVERVAELLAGRAREA